MAKKGAFDKAVPPGQPLVVWTCVLLIWVAMRIGASSMPGNDSTRATGLTPIIAADGSPTSKLLRGAKAMRAAGGAVAPLAPFYTAQSAEAKPFGPFGLTGGRGRLTAIHAFDPPHIRPRQEARGNGYHGTDVATGWQNLSTIADISTPDTSSPLPLPPLVLTANHPAADPVARQKSWQLYAYSFWRFAESNQASLAAGGQYGGSQSGIVAAQRLFRLGHRDVSLLVRAVASPGTSDGKELAAGLSLQISRKLGVRLIAEHRLRANIEDASALYIAGSFDNAPLPLKLRLSGFGQGGAIRIAGVQDGSVTAFLDAGLRAERKFLATNSVGISLGAGAWAGGQHSGQRPGQASSESGDQQNSQRLDIGPTIRLDAKLAGQPVRLHADWRFRAAGNAEPGNGLALTLSAGF